MKYETKPRIVEAEIFTRSTYDTALQKLCGPDVCYGIMIPRTPTGIATCLVRTAKGIMTATEGDYIVKQGKGEFYICSQKEFEKNYFLKANL